MMELFLPLSEFYNAIADDARIGATHISLYMALLQQWNMSGGANPFDIKRAIIMKGAKINSRCTYNKCINNLKEFGYITYMPSINSSTQSKVYLKMI
jgi:hypothetical protein